MEEARKISPSTSASRRRRPSRAETGPAALDLIARHGAAVLATARRYSSGPEDAEDAYQRGLEILLTKAPSTSEEELVPWLKTVVKHEAFALKRQRDRALLTGDDVIERAPDPGSAAHDQAERYDRLRVGAEAMQRLKPQEIRCLLLKAEGYSYEQICAETGFTYTKVNRCLTEGRRSFFERVSNIETGVECRRMTPLLSALADGEATPRDMTIIRPHLRACSSCRATLKEYRSVPARVAALFPPLALLGLGPGTRSVDGAWQSLSEWAQERGTELTARVQERGAELIGRLHERGTDLQGRLQERSAELTGRLQERAADLAGRAHASAEVVTAQKVAAVAASTAALAGGGVATVRSLDRPAEPQRAQLAEAREPTPNEPRKARPSAALVSRAPEPASASEPASRARRGAVRRRPSTAPKPDRDRAKPAPSSPPQAAEFEPAPASYSPPPASASPSVAPTPTAAPAPRPSGGGSSGGPSGGEFAP